MESTTKNPSSIFARSTTAKLVDPELVSILETFPAFNFSIDALQEIRSQVKAMFAAIPQPPDNGVTVDDRVISGKGDSPGVRVLVYTPPGDSKQMRPAFLHIHGGGYVVGIPEMAHSRNHALCKVLDCVIVSVDYRMSPEHPFPAPLEDCYAALEWLNSQAANLGIDSTRIAVGGESAGGGLAAALCLLARDRKKWPVAFQWLIYPMLDDRTCNNSTNPNTGEFMWSREQNCFGWTALLGQPPGSTGISPYASPAREEALAGLPPTFIGVGTLDLFLEEDIDYAMRLMQASVMTELHVYPGAYHGFDTYAPDSQIAQQFHRDMVEALRKGLRRK